MTDTTKQLPPCLTAKHQLTRLLRQLIPDVKTGVVDDFHAVIDKYEAASRRGAQADVDRIRFALTQAREDTTGCECLAADLKRARVEDIATAESALTRLASAPVEGERCAGFDLDKFSHINRQRCESPEGFNHALNSWEYEQWTNALAGEAGEACNAAKKLLRHRQNIAGNKGDDLNIELLERKLAGEFADCIIYADLGIQRLGRRTSDVVRDTFNDKSTQLGCQIIIPNRCDFSTTGWAV